ncbi:hypothetical protein R5W23_005439 [Gemmata sp. JC673]|uniref:Uncharacterized protein n=1 Tax=Gemmata algarum TaxID=2975278 RepID=A0ABU5FAN9_9BACT|nr:hypothetical protein [Gemmata algarum]MDY3563817.1 hypothetical protein [Gemmata algarum]
MLMRFGLLCSFAMLMLLADVGTAKAQIIVITDVQYTAPANGNPAKAEPKGTWSLPGDGNSYRVVIDYGTITNGSFTQAANVSAGGLGDLVITKVGGGGTYPWRSNGPHNLTNPPQGLYARARIQKMVGMNWQYVGGPGTEAFAPIPIPAPPPSGSND